MRINSRANDRSALVGLKFEISLRSMAVPEAKSLLAARMAPGRELDKMAG
jgi:hypothetical protein